MVMLLYSNEPFNQPESKTFNRDFLGFLNVQLLIGSEETILLFMALDVSTGLVHTDYAKHVLCVQEDSHSTWFLGGGWERLILRA